MPVVPPSPAIDLAPTAVVAAWAEIDAACAVAAEPTPRMQKIAAQSANVPRRLRQHHGDQPRPGCGRLVLGRNPPALGRACKIPDAIDRLPDAIDEPPVAIDGPPVSAAKFRTP